MDLGTNGTMNPTYRLAWGKSSCDIILVSVWVPLTLKAYPLHKHHLWKQTWLLVVSYWSKTNSLYWLLIPRKSTRLETTCKDVQNKVFVFMPGQNLTIQVHKIQKKNHWGNHWGVLHQLMVIFFKCVHQVSHFYTKTSLRESGDTSQ